MGYYKLVCFDVDGTLVGDLKGDNYWGSLYRALGGRAGVRRNQELRQLFFSGKLPYAGWVGKAIGDYDSYGSRKPDFVRVAMLHSLTKNSRKAVGELKRRGYELAIISESIDILINSLFPGHPFRRMLITCLRFRRDGRIGSVSTTKYRQRGKAAGLKLICRQLRVPLAQAVYVGDGRNDIAALKIAGLGIAFCPRRPEVARAADITVRKRDLKLVLKEILAQDAAKTKPKG